MYNLLMRILLFICLLFCPVCVKVTHLLIWTDETFWSWSLSGTCSCHYRPVQEVASAHHNMIQQRQQCGLMQKCFRRFLCNKTGFNQIRGQEEAFGQCYICNFRESYDAEVSCCWMKTCIQCLLIFIWGVRGSPWCLNWKYAKWESSQS